MKEMFKDLLVVELASVLAGPSVGMFFAELGATVIKVENHAAGGDVTRSWKLASEIPETTVSAYFSSVNWGKRSMGINLKNPEGRALVHALCKDADIVITSFKPGDAEKLQMDFTTLSALNDTLIYAELTAYGPDDPRTGYDAVLQAETGFTYLNGESGGQPVKMPVALIDVLAAHQLKEGILLALIRRMKTGKGSHVQASLAAAAVASLVNQATNWLVAGKIPERIGSDHPNISPYGTLFRTADGKELVLAIGSNGQFRELCRILGLEELPENPGFRDNVMRVKNREALKEKLQSAISVWNRDRLLAKLHEARVPAGAVHNMQEVFSETFAQQMLLQSNGVTGVSGIALEMEGRAAGAPPELGADTDAVCREFLGLNDFEISNLKKENIIG